MRRIATSAALLNPLWAVTRVSSAAPCACAARMPGSDSRSSFRMLHLRSDLANPSGTPVLAVPLTFTKSQAGVPGRAWAMNITRGIIVSAFDAVHVHLMHRAIGVQGRGAISCGSPAARIQEHARTHVAPGNHGPHIRPATLLR